MNRENKTKPSDPGNITQFELFQANGENSIDISDSAVEIKYFENLLSNTKTLSIVVVETGNTEGGEANKKGVLDGLPVRGGEKALLVMEDMQPKKNKLEFKDENAWYVNRVRNASPDTQKDVYAIDFSSKEFFSNEQNRVCKRYDGKVSDTIKKLLTEDTANGMGIKTERDLIIDDTLTNYNFIGNDKKPFYICTWLASKSIPETAGEFGGAAGYVFYENYDGFHFRSIDALFDQEPKKKYIYQGQPGIPGGYDDEIISYNINKDIDLQNNLMSGTYSNRSIFFDFYACDYQIRDFSVDDDLSTPGSGSSKDKLVSAGVDPIDSVADEFRKPISRYMNHILDVGTLPSGKNILEQLKFWKDDPYKPTYDVANTMVQSIMRYNQLYSIQIDIMIPGDFSLRAGDLVYCDFPELTTERSAQVNDQSGGIYMIASLCHRLTSRDTYTSLTLVRDSFGRKSFK